MVFINLMLQVVRGIELKLVVSGLTPVMKMRSNQPVEMESLMQVSNVILQVIQHNVPVEEHVQQVVPVLQLFKSI